MWEIRFYLSYTMESTSPPPIKKKTFQSLFTCETVEQRLYRKISPEAIEVMQYLV